MLKRLLNSTVLISLMVLTVNVLHLTSLLQTKYIGKSATEEATCLRAEEARALNPCVS